MIFKREKEVARKLEFDGLYITEQPSEDDIKGQWDRLVINTQWVNAIYNTHTPSEANVGQCEAASRIVKQHLESTVLKIIRSLHQASLIIS